MQGGALVGIMSERDYTRKVVLEAGPSQRHPRARDHGGPPITVAPQQTVDGACTS